MQNKSEKKPSRRFPGAKRVRTSSVEAWLEARRLQVGASEAAALLGLSPWQSLYSLWAIKAGVMEAPKLESRRLQRGHRYELPIIEEVRERNPTWKIEPWPQAHLLVSETLPLACTPDCVVTDDDGLALGQIKTANEWSKKDWENEPPSYYQTQVQAELLVTGLERAYLFVMFGLSDEVEVIPVERHAGFCEVLTAKAKEFWAMVESKTAPPTDGSAATLAALASIYAEPDDTAIRLDEAAEVYIAAYEQAKTTRLDAEKSEKAAKAQLLEAIGANTYAATSCGANYSCKAQTSRRLDSKRLREDHPELADEYTTETTYRVLRSCKAIPENITYAE